MPFLPVDGGNSGTVNLYYEDHGTGRPVVLIHGWPLNGASWEKQEAALLAAGHRVVAYDRRGFGASDKPSSGYDYDTFSADLDAVLTLLDLRDAVLVGFSTGSGEVTGYLGAYGSGRVSKAVVLGALPPFPLRAGHDPGGVDGVARQEVLDALHADRPASVAGFLADFYDVDVLGGHRVSDRVAQYSWNAGVSASGRATVDRVPAWLTDFRADLSKIDVPVLIIHGDADRTLPLRSTAVPLSEAVLGARLVVLEGAPHGLIWTHAAEVNEELLAFIGE
ncbi:alpha/beta fold hydrolase [Kitasatospora cineracea]|uniref:Pimeloyl-ACP methyl ester carboxylesterase n=1 Tax=Kitasatospora cineracea TaxID=88074 RepID=A0A3N4RGB5_9ACTN|nr:alpha/beta hydrolase [Kitasatospora cineracea]RPE31856.1 pimeloyl-ACP methyl ester carboxylesterase [Kitasatospora cineracea]